jgi:hypothetical protein
MAEIVNNEVQNDIYEIVRGISQAMSIVYDGPTYNEDLDNKVGLRREEGNPLLDKRVMDGFRVKVSGRKLTINYHTEVPLREITSMGAGKYENEIESMIEKCMTFLKKQYKSATQKTLSVKELKKELKSGKSVKDFDVLIQPISRFRTSVTAHKSYELTGIPEQEEYRSEIVDQYEKYHKNLFKEKKKSESAPKKMA